MAFLLAAMLMLFGNLFLASNILANRPNERFYAQLFVSLSIGPYLILFFACWSLENYSCLYIAIGLGSMLLTIGLSGLQIEMMYMHYRAAQRGEIWAIPALLQFCWIMIPQYLLALLVLGGRLVFYFCRARNIE